MKKKKLQQQQTNRVSLLLVRLILEENLLTSKQRFQQRIAVTLQRNFLPFTFSV